MDETSVRRLLETALGDEPPLGPVARNSLRVGIKLRRRARIRRAAGGAAVVIVFAAVIPVAIGTLANTPAARHHAPRPPGPWVPPNGTAYVINSGGGTVTPIDLATSTAEKPIDVSGEPVTMAIAPDGKTAYVGSGAATAGAEPTSEQTMTPIDLATNTAGKPINLQQPPDAIVITPDGKTAYVINGFPSRTVTPIYLATGTPEKPITLSPSDVLQVFSLIAMAPDGKIYVAAPQPGTKTPAYGDFMPFDPATNSLGKPVKVSGAPVAIVIAPDGTTAYVMSYPGTVTPIDLTTNTAGKPINIGGKPLARGFIGEPFAIAISPDGTTAYVANGASGTVTPINLTTSTPGKPIHISGKPGADAIAISPDGTTAYVANQPSSTVTPIYLATGTPEKPIRFGHGWDSGFEAIAIVP
jgi:DNA-binding beta-propeller fold protein YncE